MYHERYTVYDKIHQTFIITYRTSMSGSSQWDKNYGKMFTPFWSVYLYLSEWFLVGQPFTVFTISLGPSDRDLKYELVEGMTFCWTGKK